MQLTPKIQKAINIAAEKHAGQKRKNTGSPFIVHPFAVAFILSKFHKDEDVIAAGLLHDVLEDTKGYTFLDMKKDFGLRVAKIVREVSENKTPNGIKNPRASWDLRKKRKLIKLKNASREALMVTAADEIHNLKSIINDYEEQGEKIWKKFNASPEKKFEYYNDSITILKKKLKGNIVKELEIIYNEACGLHERKRRQTAESRPMTFGLFEELNKMFFVRIKRVLFR